MEIHREDAVELEEDCYFIADLRECTVFDIEGKELGQIYDVIQTKNNDVFKTSIKIYSYRYQYR